MLDLISEAQGTGGRLAAACHVLGISARTIERWRAEPEIGDRRCGPQRRPSNALSSVEEAQVVAVLTSSRYAGRSPKQLVRQECKTPLSQCTRRLGRTKFGAGTSPGCRGWCAGRIYTYTLIMDACSRRIVGWRIAERESADIAAALITNTRSEGNIDPRGLALHSDNSTPMRGSSMISTLQWLGVVRSFSRPHVSDDNPYSEALFRTLEHTPAYRRLPFTDVASANRWVSGFVDWYNGTHWHSGIRYVTPDQRHHGRDRAVLASRRELYERARRANPERWSRKTRNWLPVELVLPDRERAQLQAAA
jgi:putative transposase